MTPLTRFSCMTEAVNALTARWPITRREATQIVWDLDKRVGPIGTDRSLFIDLGEVDRRAWTIVRSAGSVSQ
jgi:hypothetical protein